MRLRAWCALALVACGVLSRTTLLLDDALALWWPAIGVATLWLVLREGPRTLDLVLIGGLVAAVNVVTGSTAGEAAAFAVSNAAGAWAASTLLRRRTTPPGRPPMAEPGDLHRTIAAAALGGAVSVVAGEVVLLLVGQPLAPEWWIGWWGRNTAGTLSVVVTGLLLVPGAVGRRRPFLPGSRVEGLHALLIVATTSGVLLAEMLDASVPWSLLYPALALWAGLRASASFVAVHGLWAAAFSVVLFLDHSGPFPASNPLPVSAAAMQLLVALTLVIGVSVALHRESWEDLALRLRASEATTEAQASLLATVLRTMDEGVLVVDEDRRVTASNPAAAHLLGVAVPDDGPLPEVDVRRLDGEPLTPDRRPVDRALRGEAVEHEDVVVPGPAGVRRVLAVSAVPLDDAGPDRRVVLTLRDVTIERDRQAEVVSFARTVAHDLRGPLTGVVGWLDLLREEPLPASTAALVDRARASTERMQTLVGDLLGHALATELELRVARCDVAALALEAAAGRGVERALVLHAGPPVEADATLLRQLLDNLVGNAATYAGAHAGADLRIEVGTELVDGVVRVRVADNGPGVPVALRESVFVEFVRGSDLPGTGLGLAICRRVVERHGGWLVVGDRRDGRPGAEFTAAFPGQGVLTPPVPPAPPVPPVPPPPCPAVEARAAEVVDGPGPRLGVGT